MRGGEPAGGGAWRERYFNRVRPALGGAFGSRRLAVWGLGRGYLAAEALARTGLTRQTWLDGGVAGGGFCRSLGQGWRGQPRGEALRAHVAAHNTHEDGWEIDLRGRTPGALREVLAAGARPDLLLVEGGPDAGEAVRAAVAAEVPLVASFLPRGGAVREVHLVWLPASAADPGAVVALAEALAALPALDAGDPAAHVDALEAGAADLSLARWILAPASPAREDLTARVVAEGRCAILRGHPAWPWAVRFAEPTGAIAALASRPVVRFAPPAPFLGRERILVLGLGTGSLFAAEAPLLGREITVVDCRAVSPFNPVRQVFTTADVGRPKPDALAERLARRLAPAGPADVTAEGPVTWRAAGRHRLGAAELLLRPDDPDALARFRAILDTTRPTLAVVAMGRSRDDNFTATAELRRRGIRHVTPTAFPAVTHFKHILTDGRSGPCYDCIQGHLAVDGGPGPTLAPSERDLLYGGSQPATLAETLPSAASLLRLARDLSLPPAARPPYLARELHAERPCFVGANRVERSGEGWLYGVEEPLSMVTYGVEDIVGSRAEERCPCGRVNPVRRRIDGA